MVIAICETNAYYAYVATLRARDRSFTMSRESWKLKLSQELINNPLDAQTVVGRVRSRDYVESHAYVFYANGVNARCKVCTNGQTKHRCACGIPVCNPANA
jgi:hypothetical protein